MNQRAVVIAFWLCVLMEVACYVGLICWPAEDVALSLGMAGFMFGAGALAMIYCWRAPLC